MRTFMGPDRTFAAATPIYVAKPRGEVFGEKRSLSGAVPGATFATYLRNHSRGDPMPKKLLKVVKDIPALEVGPTPAGLGPDGTALWNTVQSEYRIDDCGGRALLA